MGMERGLGLMSFNRSGCLAAAGPERAMRSEYEVGVPKIQPPVGRCVFVLDCLKRAPEKFILF